MKTVAKVIIRDSKSRILILVRSSSHPFFANHLDFPGGEVEIGEDNITGIIREIQEELGINLSSSKIKLLFDKKIKNNLTHVLYEYWLDGITPHLDIGWEHSDYKWLDETELLKQELPAAIDPYYKDVINFLSEHYQRDTYKKLPKIS